MMPTRFYPPNEEKTSPPRVNKTSQWRQSRWQNIVAPPSKAEHDEKDGKPSGDDSVGSDRSRSPLKAKEPERFRLDLDNDREFDESYDKVSPPNSSQIPGSSGLPPTVVPWTGPTLPEIDASDADEPRPEPSIQDQPILHSASSKPDSDPYVDKLRRELQEQKERHEREMEAYQ